MVIEFQLELFFLEFNTFLIFMSNMHYINWIFYKIVMHNKKMFHIAESRVCACDFGKFNLI